MTGHLGRGSVEASEDKLLLLEMAFSLVVESVDFRDAPLNARVEMVIRTFNQLMVLVDLKALGVRQ